MEKIEHTSVMTNGIKMHVASIGMGPEILFLHGFPELWYSWRYQLLSLSSLGYRCIAPDLGGYGDTDAPASVREYSIFHILGDLIGLLDSLGIEQVFLVGHDWGAQIAWHFCLFRPDKIKALLNLSVPFLPRNPQASPVEMLRALYGDDHYISRFQEPGEVEEQFAQVDAAKLLKFIYTCRDPKPPRIPKEMDYGSALPDLLSLPSWLSEEDVNYYSSKFKQKGITGPVNYYRAMNLSWELTAPWTGSKIEVPTKFIVGDLDVAYHMEYILNGGLKNEVLLLEEVVVMEGVAHFLNQEKSEEVNKHIYDFFKKF